MDGEIELLGERIAEQAAHLDAATHRLLADVREFDVRGGWHAQGALSCAHWLAWRVGWDLVTARDRVRVARKLGEFPTVDDALRRGEVSYSKVRAILRVATPANETMLLEYARLTTASQLEKLSRKYALVQRHGEDSRPRDDVQRRYVRRRDTGDGMVKIEAVLHPEEAELVWRMLDHAAKHLASEPRTHLTSDASAETHGGPVATSPSGPTCPSDASAEAQGTADVPGAASSGPTCLSDDSVDAALMLSEPASDGVSLAPGTLVCPGDDSAEARAHAAATMTTPRDTMWSGGDSAASPEAINAHARLTCRGGESARSSADTSVDPGQSLLDRLLAEGQALGRVEPVTTTGLAVTACPGPASAGVREPGVLHQHVDANRRAFNRADALVSIAQAYLSGDRPDRAPVEVMITIPASSLRNGAPDPSDVGCMGDAGLSAEAARRLSCDAGVIEVIEDEHGVPLSVGRKRRTIAGSIKRALLKRDTACTFPGCTHRIFLEGHHIRHWADGGETSLLNTALLCSLHHRHVHEYGYTIELGADQRPQFRDPGGRLVPAVPASPELPDLGWPGIRAANGPLAIDANTIACGWDGTPVHYGAVVGQLVVVDSLT